MKRRKRKPLSKTHIIIMITALVLVLAALAGWLLYRRQKNIVMTSGDLVITNRDFSYFLWARVHEKYGENAEQTSSLNLSLTLDVQMYDEDTTWEEFLKKETIDIIQEQMAMVLAAEAEGFQLPEEDQKNYEEELKSLRQIAEDMKYDSFKDYLVATFGKGATVRSFEKHLYDVYLADAYVDVLFDRTIPTQEQVEEFYEIHRSDYEEGDYDTARQHLHQDEFYNAIGKAKAEHPFKVLEENIVITHPKGAEVQIEEHTDH